KKNCSFIALMDEQMMRGWLNDLQDRFETLAQQRVAAFQQQLEAFHVKHARMTEAHFEAIAKKDKNILEKTDTTLSLPSEEASHKVEGPLDASEDTLLSSRSEDLNVKIQEKAVEYVRALNVAPLEVVFAGPNDEESTSGKTVDEESVGIKNEHVDVNEGKSLNLVVAANDVSNNGFSEVDHQWQGDLFATAGVVQVDTWNHNRSQPVNTFE
nr:hypothetical protein [Tanacetum cinerariifolium]